MGFSNSDVHLTTGELVIESHIHIHVHVNIVVGHLVINNHLSGHLVANLDLLLRDHVRVNIHVNINHALSSESNIDTANFSGVPVLRNNDGLELEFRVVDFNGGRNSRGSNTASAHGARDFKVIFRSDQSTSSGGVEDIGDFLKVDQMVSHIPGLGLVIVTTLESGKIDSNEVAVTSTTGLDTLEISLDLGEDLVFVSATSSQVQSLLKSEGNSVVIRRTLGVIEFHDDLSSFTRSIVILFELSSKGIFTLAAAAARGKLSGDFSGMSLGGILDGLSDNERLLGLESRFALERGFQDSFESIADIGEVSVTFLMERGGEVAWKHEGEGDGVLTRE